MLVVNNHMRYKDIYVLYDDLKEKIEAICLYENRVRIIYHNDVWEIEQCTGGFRTYYNGKKEKGITEEQDIYFFALEFAHEKQIGLKELFILDTAIMSINEEGFTYVDFFDRKHFILFEACKNNYHNIYPQSVQCIGERDVTHYSFTFKYYGLTLVVKMKQLYVFKKKSRVLYGKKINRFEQFRNRIQQYGYTTYDLS